MSENSAISWTDHTFNPWVGCTKVSPACEHCYAERWAKRAGKAAGVVWGGERRRTATSNWAKPLKWHDQAGAFMLQHGRRQRVFCASLADVFDNEVDPAWRADLFALIQRTPSLDWLLLTKRIGNVKRLLPVEVCGGELPSNVWLGATICNQEEAERDIYKLQAVAASVRFLSIEPMLGPVDLHDPFVQGINGGPRVGWVICGGESGPNARPMHPDWVRSLRDQCRDAGVPFHFKQWGEWAPGSGFNSKPRAWIDRSGRIVTELDDFPKGAEAANGWSAIHMAGKNAAGRLLDGVLHDAFPEGA